MDDGWKGRLGRDRAAPSGELGGLRSSWCAPAVLEHSVGAAGAGRSIDHAEFPLLHPGGNGNMEINLQRPQVMGDKWDQAQSSKIESRVCD